MNAILSHYLLGTSTSPQGFQFCIASDGIQESIGYDAIVSYL
jgi:hypothetical protein